MNEKKNFAIITDFGFDYSVASMKALLFSNFPEANIIDIDHSIEKFSILSGAFVINSVYRYFPQGTIFICVVDPGVGSDRSIIFVKIGNYYFIGPNNGVFHHILKDAKDEAIIKKINDSAFAVVSNTFHGRDIMTPAAIEIANGNESILSELDDEPIIFIKDLELGHSVIIYIDNFGNIKTNISSNFDFGQSFSAVTIKINDRVFTAKFLNTFSEAKEGELICYRGSNGTLEVAVNLGSARNYLLVNIGDKIAITPIF